MEKWEQISVNYVRCLHCSAKVLAVRSEMEKHENQHDKGSNFEEEEEDDKGVEKKVQAHLDGKGDEEKVQAPLDKQAQPIIACLHCPKIMRSTTAMESHQQTHYIKFYRACGKCKNRIVTKAEYNLHKKNCEI